MYFEYFPKTLYDFSVTDSQDVKYVTDFFHRVKITAEMINGVGAYQKYIVKDGETPEIISHKLYGTPLYHWAIMMANDFTNPYTDFPMSSRVFEEYMDENYYNNRNDIHHYEDSLGNIITPITIIGIGSNCLYNPVSSTWEPIDVSNYTSVTNEQYEFLKNEKKRTINIIRPQFIGAVVRTFEEMMNK